MARRDIRLKMFTLWIVEIGLVVSAVLLTLYWRLSIGYGISSFEELFLQKATVIEVITIALVSQFIFYLFGLYDITTARSRWDWFLSIIQAVSVAWAVLGLIALVVYYINAEFREEFQSVYSYHVPLTAMGMTLFFMICWRVVIHWLLSHPALSERILIVGTGDSAVDLANEVLSRRYLGYRVVGFLGEERSQVGQSLVNPGVIGIVEDLNEIVGREDVDRVVVALSDRRGHLPVDQLLQLRLQGTAVIEEGTALYERVTGKISVDMLRPSWIIFSGGNKRSRMWLTVRRWFNVLVALVGILTSFPIWIVTAIIIKLESPGPVFYKQERVGKNGKPFTIYKFRSMRNDAEKDGPVWATKGDARTTRFGSFIRKVRIDELPQFINVLKGEMAFVGPRPERPFFVEQLNELIPFYSQRHLVEPGVTGWAQVRYEYGASVEDALQKLQYDLYYIKNASLLFDLWISLESIKIVLFGRGR